MSKERTVVIVDGVRTPFGRLGGSLKYWHMAELYSMTIKGLVEKTGICEKYRVDSVYSGSAFHDSHCNNPARWASLHAGLPYEVSASYVEMQCGSAIAAINHAAWEIKEGNADVIIAGGAESTSQKAAKMLTITEPYKALTPQWAPFSITPNPADNLSMLQISDRLAEVWGVSREECDAFGYRSQANFKKAQDAGYFDEELLKITLPAKKGQEPVIFAVDEHPRPQTTMEGLAKLKTVNPGGVTTAGNASGRNDGAAAVLMMTEEKAKELGYTPICRWVMGADVGCDPKVMGIGPAYSNTRILKRMGLKIADLSVVECNEAFAAQNLAVIKEMQKIMDEPIDMDIWNPNGGAIAVGHPNGASGARICIFAMKELARRGGRYAMFGSCCGGGLGVSTLLERI